MRTAEDHLRAHPRALPKTLSFIERRNEKVEQLKREVEAKAAGKGIPVLDAEPAKPRRLKFSLIFMPWHWRFG
jgi:hypothetical protein